MHRCLLVVVALSMVVQSADAAWSSLDELDQGWNAIEPGGGTICSDGSPYKFFVRPADRSKLLVYFQGGGACWLPENCDPHLKPSYKVNVAQDDPAQYKGIFDFTNPENPFREYSVVMVPYCTADVHLGNEVVDYDAPEAQGHAAHSLAIHHRGIMNSDAVLEWVYAQFGSPERIFVTGSSAGAIPSPFYAWQIADHYPDARVAQLGDGAGGYRRSATTQTGRMARWGTLEHLARFPEFAQVPEEKFTYEMLYVAAAKRHPDVMFAEYDAAEDSVQKRYLAMAGSDAKTLKDLILANHADIRSAVPNFRAFIAGGDSHTILGRPEFYTYAVGGTRVRDWVAALANYQDVADVACTDCSVAEERKSARRAK